MSKWIFFVWMIPLFLFSHETKQHLLPNPFCVFEHLYFNVDQRAFCANGEVDMEKALSSRLERDFSFYEFNDTPEEQQVLQGTTLFLFEGTQTQFLTHFFHLLEHVVGIWSFYGAEHAHDVKRIILYTSEPWHGPNQINYHLLKALFPFAKIQNWEDFLHENQGKFLHLERVVTSDRGISFQSKACGKWNKMLGEALPFLSANALSSLAKEVGRYAHAYRQHTENVKVTYLTRPFPRTLAPDLEQRLWAAIQELPGVELKVVDFAAISFQEQIQHIRNTDVLISVHGNGLSHILFLPDSSTAIEILPNDTFTVDYRLFADARGIDYLGINNQGVISKEKAYQIGMRGNFSGTIYHLDLFPILDKILHK